MDVNANGGVRIRLDNDEVEKLIKILIHHPSLNVGTPKERESDEINDLLELSNKIEKLDSNLVCSCKAIRSVVKQSGANFEDILKMINNERRMRENCFSLLNKRISNMERLLMDKIVELEDIIRKMSSNNGGTSPNTKEADNANLSISTDSTRGVSGSSYTQSDDNVIEEDCNENSKN